MSCDDDYDYEDVEEENKKHEKFIQFKKEIREKIKKAGKNESGVLFSMLYDLCVEYSLEDKNYVRTFVNLHEEQIKKIKKQCQGE